MFRLFQKKKVIEKHSNDYHSMVVEDNNNLKLDSTDIEIKEEIGRGGYGIVKLANLKSRQTLVACKAPRI
jgi:hypothetical protein